MRTLPFAILAALALVACSPQDTGTGASSSSASSLQASSSAASVAQATIEVGTPLPGQTVHSPLTVSGKARGTWFFEASFPVKLVDANQNLNAQGTAQAQAEWMTEDFVPFSTTLTYTTNATSGFLILMKDNPSGLPENDASVSIPVNF
jgi:hypothetical protein